jgi:DNA polymerase III delta subunit
MTNDEQITEGSEFYHRDIFGSVVDVELNQEEEISDEVRSASSSKGEFNFFALTDAVGDRKKKDAWVLYEKALASGQVPEQVFYKLMWLFKTMLLAERCSSAEEAKLNPFVYRKSKSFLKNYKKEEIENLSRDLVVGYHQARRGEGEIETLIEKLLLSL